MPRTKKPAPENLPIETSGSVFLLGILEEDLPQARMPRTLMVGDIRLHNVPKKGERFRHQQPHTFEGFIVASIWDGKKFRKLLLRKRGGVESTYTGRVERRERVHGLIRHLKSLVRRTAYWYTQDSGYEIPWNDTAPVIKTVAEPAPAKIDTPAIKEALPPQAVPQATVVSSEPVAEATTVKVTVEVVGQTVVHAEVTTKTGVAPTRRRRKKFVDENQQELFPDEKAS